MSLATYILPGVMVDLLLIIMRHRACCALCCFLAGLIANLTGSFLSNAVFFRLPFIPLMLSLIAGALSGGLGGIIAWNIVKMLENFNPALRKEKKDCEANEK